MYNSTEHLIFYMIMLSSFDVRIKKLSSHDFHTWKTKMELCCITSFFGIKNVKKLIASMMLKEVNLFLKFLFW